MTQELFDTFVATNKADWVKSAETELSGTDPFKKLSKVVDGLEIRPYYDASDISIGPEFKLPTSHDPFLGPRTWYNMPPVNTKDARAANEIALAHLAAGADGILFNIESHVNIEVLLNNIELPYCNTFFLIKSEHAALLSELKQYSITKKFDSPSISGGVFWKSNPLNQKELTLEFQNWDRFFVLGHSVKYPDPVDAVVDALTKGIDSIDIITNNGGSAQDAIAQQACSFEIGNNFFIEIAKLKAFRRLWQMAITAFEVGGKPEISPFVHGISLPWKSELYNPNSNMLKSTTTAIAAIIGGCDGITICAEEEDHTVQSRMARNVSNILREESHLNKTCDPIAGSFYVEALIDELAEKAWNKFKEKI